ncbi:hypothetical protein G3W26_29480 [Klebsiella variicola]|nr:hypothetical protein [Klebsiella variicola]
MANTYWTLDVSGNELGMQVRFFEDGRGAAAEAAVGRAASRRIGGDAADGVAAAVLHTDDQL